MKKGILLLSALLLIGVSACDFCGTKHEETKTVTEQAPAAEVAPVAQEVAMNEEAPCATVTEEEAPCATVTEEETVVGEEAPVAEEAK